MRDAAGPPSPTAPGVSGFQPSIQLAGTVREASSGGKRPGGDLVSRQGVVDDPPPRLVRRMCLGGGHGRSFGSFSVTGYLSDAAPHRNYVDDVTGDEPPGNGPVTSSSRGLPAEREENAGPIRPRARVRRPFFKLHSHAELRMLPEWCRRRRGGLQLAIHRAASAYMRRCRSMGSKLQTHKQGDRPFLARGVGSTGIPLRP